MNNQLKNRLKSILFDSFHEITNDESDKLKCLDIISIAKQNELDSDFIDELESAYNVAFVK